MQGRVPLERALSKLGIASRSESRKWIEAKRVAVDGKIVSNPIQMVVPEKIKIEIDGIKIGVQEKIVIAVHKPKSVVTTRSDEKNRPTIYSVFDSNQLNINARYLAPVGRLDFASTGLILMTNDTRFSSWVTDPVNKVPRVYIVTVRGNFTLIDSEKLVNGIVHQGEELGAVKIEILKSSGKESVLKVELNEGKNREIRRMMKEVNHEVTRLLRISFGGIELKDMRPGEYRVLEKSELVNAFTNYKF